MEEGERCAEGLMEEGARWAEGPMEEGARCFPRRHTHLARPEDAVGVVLVHVEREEELLPLGRQLTALKVHVDACALHARVLVHVGHAVVPAAGWG